VVAGGSNPTGGGGNGGSSGSGAGGGAQANVTGTVQEYVDSGFTALGSTLFSKPALVTALPSMVTSTYDSANNASTQFDLMNVPSGPTWFLVQDQPVGSANVYPTLSYSTVPAAALALPLIAQEDFNQVASAVAGVGGVTPGTAQVVLILYNSNGTMLYSGVSVTGGSGNGTIAYDTGVSGTYSSLATSTGAAGTVILFNAALNGLTPITLLDTATMTPFSLSVWTNPNAVTLLVTSLK
jgi:hypothetical protein